MKTSLFIGILILLNNSIHFAQDIIQIYTLQPKQQNIIHHAPPSTNENIPLNSPLKEDDVEDVTKNFNPCTSSKKSTRGFRFKLKEAISQKLIELKQLRSNGGNYLEFKLHNLTGNPIELSIEPGQVFKPNGIDSNNFQNVIVPNEEIMAINPSSVQSFTIRGYCCNSGRKAANSGVPFVYGKMATGALLNLCKYINMNCKNDESIQSAIWCFTNNQYLDSVSKKSKLKSFTFKLIKMEKSGVFNTTESQFVYDVIYYELKTNGIVKLEFRDVFGNRIYTYTSKKTTKAGNYKFVLNLTTKNWEKGQYSVSVVTNNSVLSRKYFTI